MRTGRYLAWIALALWTVTAVALLPLAGRTSAVVSTDPALLLPNSAEATRAMIRERTAFPGSDTPVAVVVYVRAGGLTAADRATVDGDRTAFAALARDHAVAPAEASTDGQALLLAVPLGGGDEAAVAAVGRIRDRLAGAPTGLTTAVTGSAGALADVDDAVGDVDTRLFLVAAAVVAVLLLITYRSPVLWVIPLASVALASQLASGVVYLLARYADITVSPTALGIMTVLVFGAGTDYALLLIARYREELHHHRERRAAMAVALRRSFPALLASAGTVVLGLLCLLGAQMNDLRGLGPVAAVGIAVGLAVMTTLLPALLVLLGRWVFWPFIPRYLPGAEAAAKIQRGAWHRLATNVGSRPRIIWVATTLGLIALSFGVFGMRSGQATDEMYTSEVGSVTGQRLLNRHYPGGTSAPARIVAAAGTADAVRSAVAGVPGVAAVHPGAVSADGRWTLVDAVLADPADSAAAKATIDRVRAAVRAVPGAEALVGGATATMVDTGRAASRDNRVMMPLILVVVFVVLVLLLRALVAAVLLIASVVLSYAAAMGLAGLIFQALGYPAVDPSILLYGFIFLVTLGVDYTIFLMTRAREEVARAGNRAGILSSLTVTGGVITSAGLVLAGTFATLIVLPLVSAMQMGIIVAVGVLLDTFVVRTLLVPALGIDVGPRLWWPTRRAVEPATPHPAPVPAEALIR